MPLATRAPDAPRGCMPGPSARLGQALSTSRVGSFSKIWRGVFSLFRASLLLSICIHGSNAREARPLVAARRDGAAASMTRVSRAVAQAAQVQRVAPPDAQALDKLWQGWGKDKGLEGWGSPWLCNATGLECSTRGRVSALRLSYMQLQGSIASDVGNLISLRYLDISSNQLTGILPSSIGRMSSLETLNLRGNVLSGSLPSSIGQLISLTYLTLYDNQLSGSLPSSIGRMIALEHLDLHNNQMSGSLPSSIWQLTSLGNLDLSSNQLTGSLPSSIGRMSSITNLKLTDNKLTGSLPSSIGQMRSLGNLDLSKNQLSGSLPISIGQMSILSSLTLNDNQLSGSLPASMRRMISLVLLNLSSNQLTGSLPSSLMGILGLKILDLSSNYLTGNVAFCFRGSMTAIKLSSNLLTGSLPSSLGGMRDLDTLDISSNHLTGSLPISIGKMSSIQTLDLSSNHLTGSLPSSFGGMSNLGNLDLSNNQLTGSLPSSIGGMSRLEILGLSNNQLTGSLPSCIMEMRSLLTIDLSSNQLTGNLPSSIERMSSLTHLNLSSNRLSGSLSPGMSMVGAMYQLALLDLSSNSLSGEVPVSLSGLWGLSHLDLGRNSKLKASASFLSGIAGLSRLQHLGLALPRLNAPLASLRLPWGRLTFLSLEGANVSGPIPDSAFDASSSLKSLNLQGTAVQGVLPTGLALLSSLSVMRLPGRVQCPPGPCRYPTVARNQAYCARCPAFCATCPAAGSFRDSLALLEFQETSGNFPGTWTNSSFDGVSLDRNGRVQAISLTSNRWLDSAHKLRFDVLPAATLRTLILSSVEYEPFGNDLSETLSCLTSLRMLHVGLVKTTRVPALSHLSSLTALDFSGHILPDGELPATLVGLRSLDLSGVHNSGLASLTGVPSALSRFTKLTQLDLSGNTIPGPIPSFLSSLRLLANLDLSGNTFEGSVPESLSLLGNLTALNLGKNGGQLSLPSGLATLPLVYLIVDEWACLNRSGRTPCPPHKVNPSSPFCKRYCPQFCKPCYPPPSPPPPQTPPPALPPPLPPSTPASDGNVAAIAGAASAAGVLVLLTAAALWCVLIRKQRRPQDDDDIEKRGVRSLSAEEVEEMTGSFCSFIGGEGDTEMYGGETGQGQGVIVWVRESGSGRNRKAAEQAFRKEVWLLSGIHHRYLQELQGYYLTPRKQYLVFESHEQGSLLHFLREDPMSLTWSRRLRIALTAALGLDYLHSQLDPPLVHKDVKSRSILVTAEFEGKVGVAGLGALEFGDEGSLGYADPSKGEQGSPTAKCDVYAFGVVLLELATGLPPLEGKTHILSRVLELTASEDGLEKGIPVELQGEGQQHAQGEGMTNDTGIKGVGSAPLLTLEAFKSFLGLGVSCCSFNPHDRPSMAQVSSVLEELLQGKSLPLAPFPAPGKVPFPEYEEPIRGPPKGPTELLAVSFTMTGNNGKAPPKH